MDYTLKCIHFEIICYVLKVFFIMFENVHSVEGLPCYTAVGNAYTLGKML